MVYKRFARKRKPRVRKGRRFPRTRRKPRSTRGVLFPQQQYATLTYAFPVKRITIPNGAQQDYFLLGNGLTVFRDNWDDLPGQVPAPLLTAAIPAPNINLFQGIQIWSQIYGKMNVVSSKVRFTITGDGGNFASDATNLSISCSAYARSPQVNESSIPGMASNLLQSQRQTKRGVVSSTGGKNHWSATMSRSSSKMLGIKDIFDASETQCNLNPTMTIAGSNPIYNSALPWFFNIRVQNQIDVGSSYTFTCFVTQRVRFTERNLYFGDRTSALVSPPGPPV